MNAFMNVMHTTTCNCTACTTVPTLGIKMPYEEEEKKATKTRKTRQKLIVGENDLATVAPEVAAMLSEKDKHFAFEVTAGSNRKLTFVCPDCKKEFEAKICSVTIAVCPCPYCRKVKKARRNPKPIVGVNDLASQCPQAVAMWSEKNKCYPAEVFAQSTKTAIFNCPKCKHEFETTVTSFVKSIKKSKGNTTGCPICNGTKVVVGCNDLATTCPQVAAMLSKKNADFATKYTMGSNAVASFTCPDCKKEFEAKICKVTNVVYPCPYCRDTKNAFDEVRHIFGYNNKYGVDFVDNTRKVCMEYNGVYWHKDKKRVDCYKFIKIHNAGYTFIRILEPGLKAFDKKYDIVLPKNYKHGNEYESKIMEDLGYKLISLFEEIYNYKATPEIQKLVDFKEFEKWYDIHRKRISAKATDNAAKKAA